MVYEMFHGVLFYPKTYQLYLTRRIQKVSLRAENDTAHYPTKCEHTTSCDLLSSGPPFVNLLKSKPLGLMSFSLDGALWWQMGD